MKDVGLAAEFGTGLERSEEAGVNEFGKHVLGSLGLKVIVLVVVPFGPGGHLIGSKEANAAKVGVALGMTYNDHTGRAGANPALGLEVGLIGVLGHWLEIFKIIEHRVSRLG